MDATKPWYLSRTIWASIVAACGALAGMAGLPIDALEQETASELLVQGVTAIAGIAAVLGRIFATSRIG